MKHIRDYGIKIGKLDTGKNNLITDVKGVKVGHHTIINGEINTGVTMIMPTEDNIYSNKLLAATYVINGYGKTAGTIQIDELGTLETPIGLTNTLSVGAVHHGIVEHMIKTNNDIGDTTSTVNPVVGECNDGHLNEIRGLHVKPEHVHKAIEDADVLFEEGCVGAGAGMSCYGLKGGIGSSSRVITFEDKTYTVGVLVLSNFGKTKDLTIDGKNIGKQIAEVEKERCAAEDKGSIITVIATDIPMTNRQIKRICKRVSAGLARTGSHLGHGSGDIVLGFSTGNRIDHYTKVPADKIDMFNENNIDIVFRAVVEATEESVLNSMLSAEFTKGFKNHTRACLRDYMYLLN